MKRHIVFLGMVLLLAVFGPAALAADRCDTAEQLQAAINSAPDDVETEIAACAFMDRTVTVPAGKKITLYYLRNVAGDPGGPLRREGFTGPFFRVEQGGSLSLDYIRLNGDTKLPSGFSGLDALYPAEAPLIECAGELTIGDRCGLQNNNNVTEDGKGGGIYIAGTGKLTIGYTSDQQYSGVTRCQADYGGGIYLEAGASLVLTQQEITNCHARKDGGAIYAAGALTFPQRGTGVVAKSCDAAGNGGGLYWTAGSAEGLAFRGDRCRAGQSGGGIYALAGEIRGAVLQGCNAVTEGGGIYAANGAVLSGDSVSGSNTDTGVAGGVYLSAGACVDDVWTMRVKGNFAGGRLDSLTYTQGSGRVANLYVSGGASLLVPDPPGEVTADPGSTPLGVTLENGLDAPLARMTGSFDGEVGVFFSDIPGYGASRSGDLLYFAPVFWSDLADPAWLGDRYETEEHWYIFNMKQLAAFARAVNEGHDFRGKTVELHSNAVYSSDLSSAFWDPIGTPEHPFRGNFRGFGSAVITGLAQKTAPNGVAGLFGCTDGADIDYVRVSAAMTLTTGTDLKAGALAGWAKGGTEIRNCIIEGSIDVPAGSTGCLGGAVGLMEDSTLANTRCWVALGGEDSPSLVLGGAVGEARGESLLGALEVLSSVPGHAGGVLGRRGQNVLLQSAFWAGDGGAASQVADGGGNDGESYLLQEMLAQNESCSGLRYRLNAWVWDKVSEKYMIWMGSYFTGPAPNGSYFTLAVPGYSSLEDGRKLAVLLNSGPARNATAEQPFEIPITGNVELRSIQLPNYENEYPAFPAVTGHVKLVGRDPAFPYSIRFTHTSLCAAEGGSLTVEDLVIVGDERDKRQNGVGFCPAVVTDGGTVSLKNVQLRGDVTASSGELILYNAEVVRTIVWEDRYDPVPDHHPAVTVGDAQVFLSGRVRLYTEIYGSSQSASAARAVPAVLLEEKTGCLVICGALTEDSSIGFTGTVGYPAVRWEDEDWLNEQLFFVPGEALVERVPDHAGGYLTRGSTAWADYAFMGEVAAENNTYLIENPVQLAWVAAKCAETANFFKGKTVRLAADLDLLNKTWTPIGSISTPFSGAFDGAGHSITGLSVRGSITSSSAGAGLYHGLFGFVQNGRLQDLSLSGAVYVDGDNTKRSYAGALAGYLDKSSVSDVQVNASVTGVSYVGGLLGYHANSGTIERCTVAGTVEVISTAASEYVGVGGITAISGGTLRSCVFSGTITNRNPAQSAKTCGLVCMNLSGGIYNCGVFGTVTAYGGQTAGLARLLASPPIANCVMGAEIRFAGPAENYSLSQCAALIIGSSPPSSMRNTYWLADEDGPFADDDSTILPIVSAALGSVPQTDCASFTETGAGSFTVGGKQHTVIEQALNEWVSQTADSAYCWWKGTGVALTLGRRFGTVARLSEGEASRAEGRLTVTAELSDTVPTDGAARAYLALYQENKLCAVHTLSTEMVDKTLTLTVNDCPEADRAKLMLLRRDDTHHPLTEALPAELP